MDYHEKILILNKYFSKYASDRNLKDMENTIRSMKSIHGKVVNTMSEVQSSSESNKLEVLSDLQIVSYKMASIISEAMIQYDQLISLNEKAEAVSNDEDNKKLVKNAPSLIYFYAEWCGYCKQFLPTWNAMESEIVRDDLNLVKFSCVANKEKCEKIDIIQGYPTIILYKPDTHETIRFEGERSRASLLNFVKEHTGIKV